MPWAESDRVTERLRFVAAVNKRRSTFRSVCATFGIAPKTGYKWLHQFQAEGPAGLRDRSRRPKGNSRSISGAVAKRLLELREETGYGPKKLVVLLAQEEPRWDVPAASTVGELLRREGVVTPRKRTRSRAPQSNPLRHADRPNAVWAMDFKGWFRLGDGTRCDPLTITDAYSRYLLCCRAGTIGDMTANSVWTALERTFREYGMPAALRVDNGQPWATSKGELGITTLSVKLVKHGVVVERIEPGKPYQNGRHERFHLTLQEATARPPELTLSAQQARFDAFHRVYNEARPHEALGQRAPAKLYARSTRSFPRRPREPEYPSWYRVLSPYATGQVCLHGGRYFISTALYRERVGFAEVEEGCFEVYFFDTLLGRIHTSHPELGMVAA